MTALAALATLLVVGCGPDGTAAPIQASSATNGGIVPVTRTGMYSFVLTGMCGNDVRFASDSGKVDYLTTPNGKLYLTSGNWLLEQGQQRFLGDPTSFEVLPCPWTLVLTPVAN